MMAALGWKELYSDLQVNEVYNLNKFSKYISSLFNPVISIDFSGIDLLTDEVLHVLKKSAKPGLKQVQTFSCAGCPHVSDNGVSIIASVFPELEKVCLDGCRLVTSNAIHHLIKRCPKLTQISLIGTSVVRVPPDVSTDVQLILDGCPVVIPSQKDQSDWESFPETKVVILGKELPNKLTVSLMELLTKGEVDHTLDLPLCRYHPRMKSPWDESQYLNIFEYNPKTVIYNPFISEKAVYIIPFIADLEDPMMNTELDIMQSINAIRANVTRASFVIVIMYSTESEEMDERIKRLLQDIQHIIDQQKVNLERHLQREEWNSSIVKEKDLLCQIRYGRSLAASNQTLSFHFVTYNLQNKKMEALFEGGTSSEQILAMKQEAEEAQENWLKNYHGKAVSMLDRMNKSDLSEMKSFSSPPMLVLESMRGLAILFGSKDLSWSGIKRLLNNHMLIARIKEFDPESIKPAMISALKKLIDNPDLNVESLRRVSYAAAAIWMWVEAMYQYQVTVCPKMAQMKSGGMPEQMDSVTRITATSQGPEVFYSTLKETFIQMKEFYHEENLKFPPDVIDIIKYLSKAQKMCTLTQHIGGLPENFQKHSRDYHVAVLKYLHEMGKILFYPDSDEQFIVLDIQWFVTSLQQLHKIQGHRNALQCTALDDEVQLFTTDILHNEVLKGSSELEISQLVEILKHLGMLLDVPNRIPSASHVTGQMCLFAHLSEKPVMRLKDKTTTSTNSYMINNWVNYKSPGYNKADLQVTYSYKFTVGLPSTLLPRIMQECMRMGHVTSCSEWVLAARCGGVDILIRHHQHAIIMASTIDVSARVSSIREDHPQRHIAVNHLWSIFSLYLTMVDYHVQQYQRLHVKIRIPCPGDCTIEGNIHTFSITELTRKVNTGLACPKCDEIKRLTDEDIAVINGRQRLLPFHDWIRNNNYHMILNPCSLYKDEDERAGDITSPRRLCWHCGMSRGAIKKLWEQESFVYPASATLSFRDNANPSDMKVKQNQGSILCCAEASGEEQIWILKQGIFDADHNCVELTVISPGQIVLQLAYLRTLHNKITKSDEYKPDMISMDLNLKSGIVKYRDHDKLQPEKQTELIAERGDRITVCAVKQIFSVVADNEQFCNLVQIKKNGHILHEQTVPYFNYLAVCMQIEAEKASPSLIVQCPKSPNVMTAHFNPGDALYYKTGIGNQFAVGRILEIEDGQLKVGSSEEEMRSFTVTSPDIMPLSILNNDFSIIVNKEPMKSQAQLEKFLRRHKSNPAVNGLFMWNSGPHAATKFSPVFPKINRSVHNGEPKSCTLSRFSPIALERSYEEYSSGTGKNIPKNLHFVLLPQTVSHEFLTNPTRQKVQNWAEQSLYPLCQGEPSESAFCFTRDMHMIDVVPHKIAEGDFLTMYPHNLDILKSSCYQLIHYQRNIMPAWKLLLEDINQDVLNDKLVQDRIREILHIYLSSFLLAAAMEAKLSIPTDKKAAKGMKTFAITDVKGLTGGQLNSKNKCQSHWVAKFFLEDGYDMDYLTDNPEALDFMCSITVVSLDAIELSDDWMSCLQYLPNLECLQLVRSDVESIQGIGRLQHLKSLNVEGNKIEEIPDDFESLKDVLEEMNFGGNPLSVLPDFIVDFHKMKVMILKSTLISSLPEKIGQLLGLRTLDLKSTTVTKLPDSFSHLKFLTTLILSGIWWMETNTAIETTIINRETYDTWFISCQRAASVPNEVREEIFKKADFNTSGIITGEGLEYLYKRFFDMFDHLGKNTDEEEAKIYGGIPRQIFDCRSLQTLSLSCQAIHFVPKYIGNLRRLSHLFLNNNPNLKSISAEIGKTPIKVLTLEGCHALNTPPREIVKQGMQQTIAYLKRLSTGSVACYRTKLMFVGLGGAGKTSLMRAMMSHDFKTPHLDGEAITDGIDISTWMINRGGQNVQYSVWDFAGQTLYYNTHQFFLSNRAVYLLVWNSRLGFEHSGLEFWLSSVSSHCPEAPIFVIGTHIDQVAKSDLPTTDLQRRYPCIKAFHNISSHTGLGVEALMEDLIKVTLQQPYVGEHIPEAWLNFEHKITGKRATASILQWKEISNLASQCGIYGPELHQAVRFLHELGALQHFDNEFLRYQVVINPQWIVDVMACVVTVHNKVIKDGVLRHSDIGVIWKKYPKNIHKWLISLTELFDLTFPLPDQPVNIVPCLLPQEEPKFDWPEMTDKENELMMVYKFDYLPTGLFNRAQVRLYEYSNSSKMWKYGSVLEKNGHLALVKKQKDCEVLVQAQGMRPENILLLVHEVFEALIHESFRGVHYEYRLPCFDCIKSNTKNPMMFSSDVLRRAIGLKALFLQCHTFFHSLSITQLQTIMPPVSNNEYDLQLQSTVRDLENLRDDISSDICFLYCAGNAPRKCQTQQPLDPKQLYEDLKAHNFKCWYRDDIEEMGVDDIATSIKDSKIILVFISDEFVKDDLCQRMFHFTKDILKKEYILLMVGNGREWQQSELGMQVSEKKFINFQRPPHYEAKVLDLKKQLEQQLGTRKLVGQKSDVFVSYCWVNSKISADKGHSRPKLGQVGWGDPRYIKQFLEEHDISCWLDVERTGQETGLFEDIAEGLKNARIVIACLSDDYVLSPNCQMEFRFAHITLKLPIIVVVVGTGYTWESTEIGMLSLGYPKINLQFANVSGYDQLLEMVRDKLETTPVRQLGHSSSVPQGIEEDDHKQQAFQELYELAQRKFLRQISGYTTEKFSYPRLFVLDFDLDDDTTEDVMVAENNEKDSKEENPKQIYGKHKTVDYGNDVPHASELFKEEGDEDTTDKAERIEMKRRKLKDGVPYHSQPFCIKTLCEYEGGWHCVSRGLPVDVKKDTALQVWHLVAPYMARILAILKHSSINLHIIHTDEGQDMISMLEKLAGSGADLDIKTVYQELVKFMVLKDKEGERGDLSKCHMPSGKELWLCHEHQMLPRVRVIDDRPPSVPDHMNLRGNPEQTLLHTLQTLKEEKKHELHEEDLKNIAKEANKTPRPRSSKTKHNSANGTNKKAAEQPAAPKSAITNNEEKESAEQAQRGVMSEKSDVSTADLESLADASKKTRVKFETLGHVTQVGVGISHTSQACIIL